MYEICVNKTSVRTKFYAALAYNTCSISSLMRWCLRGVLAGELIVTASPEGRVIYLYWLVRLGKLLEGMCNALVCAAAVYSVLRR